jgi:hypothetical protein
MPVFVRELLQWLRRHPLLAGLGAGVLGLVTYWQLQPVAPPVPRRAPAAPTFAGVLPPTATLEAAMATLQRENEALRLTLAEQQKLLARLEQGQQLRDEARQRERTDEARRLEAALKQALATATPPPAITTGHKVGQNHRLKNRPGCHVGALVPCCRGKNDKKRVLGARLGMARPPALPLSARAGVRFTFCDSCFLPASRPPRCARAGRQSPWPPWSSQTPFPSPQTASWW